MKSSPLASVGFLNGYWPSAVKLGLGQVLNSIFWGKNLWLRVNGKIEVARLLSQYAPSASGLSLLAVNLQRASLAGNYVGTRVPYNSVVKINDTVYAFLSEETSKQFYLDDVAATGVTTSTTAGTLKYAYQSGGTWYSWEVGFDDVILPDSNVTDVAGSVPMAGKTGVAIAPWRSKSGPGAVGNPSNTVYKDLVAPRRFLVDLRTSLTPATEQDGWFVYGTRWGFADGELKLVRKCRLTSTGTVQCAGGSPTVTGTGTQFLRDHRAGDLIRFSGAATSYTVQSVDSNLQLTLTANFADMPGSGKTVSLYSAAAEWRNNERRGKSVERDNFKPPVGRGVVLFNNSPFVWGVEGRFIYALKQTNREAVGEYPIEPPISDEQTNVLAGDEALWIMGANSLQVVTFTQREEQPYIVRIKHQPGFSNPQAGVIYGNRFYGYSDNPVRVYSEGVADVKFGRPVFERMKTWNRLYVSCWIDPKNESVLYCHYDPGSGITEIVPWMEALEPPVDAVGRAAPQWGPPQYVTGRITAGAVLNNRLFLKVDTASTVYTYEWDAGAYRTDAAVCTPYMDFGSDGRRVSVKGISYFGKAATMRIYQLLTKTAVPDVSSTGAAKASYTLTDIEQPSAEYPINLPDARGIAVRFDFSGEGNLQELNFFGTSNEVRR